MFLKEIKECNESLERSVSHLNSLPNDESLKLFIIAKQQELKEFNAENCLNIQILIQEMMKSNEILIQKFNESIQHVVEGMDSRKTVECGEVIGHVTTEKFIPYERRVERIRRRSECEEEFACDSVQYHNTMLVKDMIACNDNIIEQCELCVPIPCQASYDTTEETYAQAQTTILSTYGEEKRVTFSEEANVTSEQVISHEDRIRRRYERGNNGGFMFQNIKQPCYNQVEVVEYNPRVVYVNLAEPCCFSKPY